MRKSRQVKVGNVIIGGGAPISVQTMTNTDSRDISGTLQQLKRIQDCGCDIVRLAVPEESSVAVFTEARRAGIILPMVADIHFDYRLALAAIKAGADKIRINPGNIGALWKVKEVASACKDRNIPIRIGVNSGSLAKDLLKKYGSPTAEALAESALEEADILEKCGFSNVVISIKSSTVQTMIRSAEIVSESSDYPLHLGVTEAGDTYSGIIKNSIGIGSLLTRGIGDTIRVSLTDTPEEEIRAGKEILQALELNHDGGITLISCPTCGRTRIPLIDLVKEFRIASSCINTKGKNVKVAIMGCAVNGPGEAIEADVGIAGGDGYCVLFKHGQTTGRVEYDQCIPILLKEIQEMIELE